MSILSDESVLVADATDAPGDLDALETSLKKSMQQNASDQSNTDDSTTDTNKAVEKPDYILDKFWTGDVEASLQKQAQSYESLQSAYGKMANDLGTQRKITDRILNLDTPGNNTNGESAVQPTKVEATELIDTPTETLDAWWKEKEAELERKLTQKDMQNAAMEAELAFNTNHPDFEVVTASPEFVSWMQASPTRLRAGALAGNGNWGAADDLLTEFKGTKEPAPSEEDLKQDGIKNARGAATESASAQTAGSNKAIYRRADLIELRQTNPEKYGDPAYQAEIMAAYAEGRVK